MNIPLLIWGTIFSMLGFVFFMYGKKQSAMIPMFAGLALMIYPYFISSVIWMVVVGVILTAVPYFIRD